MGENRSSSGATARKPRADSLRNRERLLEAARAVFAAGGPDASLEAVARAAGFGIGTLYRHFPSRDALFLAVYRREVDELVALADRLGQEADTVEALRMWLRACVGMVATKRGMLAVLTPAAGSTEAAFADTRQRLWAAAGDVLRRAVEAGAVRDDVDADDVLRALLGFCYGGDMQGWQSAALRLLDIFVDGLRTRPPARK
jgi:AcrR family transcriptional regulator